MSDKIVAVMTVKKETPGKVVFEECDSSPHLNSTGGALNIYIPKNSAKTLLGGADKITMLIEPGDQT